MKLKRGGKRHAQHKLAGAKKQLPQSLLDNFVEADSDTVRVESDSLPSSDSDHEAADAGEQPESRSEHSQSEDEYGLDDESDGAEPAEQLVRSQLDSEDKKPKAMTKAEGAAESDDDLVEGSEDLVNELPSTSGRTGRIGREGSSLAGAFAEILAHPGPANKRGAAPILLGSKSVNKRHREEVEQTAAQRAAKKLRQEMKQRGHTAVLKKGENPEQDAQEKALLKIATRGVVQLFNAVSKAQKRQKEALALGAKAKDAKIDKASFFSQLRGVPAKGLVPTTKQQIGPEKGEVPSKAAAALVGVPKHSKGWDVLQDDFQGLQGNAPTKMKEWDNEVEEDDPVDEALSGSESEGLGEW